MKKNLNNRGFALILVILMVSVIVSMTIALNKSTRQEIYDAANVSDMIMLLYVAKSGFSIGEGLLRANKTYFDVLTDDWANTELISLLSERLFLSSERGGGKTFQLRVVDETGKININRLVVGTNYNPDVRELLTRLLSLPEFKLTPMQVGEITDSIKDWIDKDNDVTGAGAEHADYAALGKEYTCKNAPLDCIEELLMIKGITPTLYYGTRESPGLQNFVTLYGDGKININTAPKMILRALARDITEEAAGRMDEYRRSKDHDLSDPVWCKRIVEAAGVVIEGRLLTTKSDYFRVTSTGRFGNMTQTVTGVVKRSPDRTSTKLLSWKVL